MTEEMNDMKDDMGGGEANDSDRLMVLLGYIFPIIAVVMLLMEDRKNKPFVKYHSVMALLLAAVTFILSFTVCLWVIPWGYGLYIGWQAYSTGEMVEVAYLGDFAKNQGWV